MMEMMRAPVLGKTSGVRSRRFLNQVSKAPFNCQAIPSSPSRKPHRSISVLIDQSLLRYAAMSDPLTANRSPRRNTAQAIRASLLAKATTATLRWARSSSAFAQRPSGVSRSAT